MSGGIGWRPGGIGYMVIRLVASIVGSPYTCSACSGYTLLEGNYILLASGGDVLIIARRPGIGMNLTLLLELTRHYSNAFMNNVNLK